MPSTQSLRDAERTIGLFAVLLVAAGLFFGVLLRNWDVLERGVPLVVVVVVLYLFYRLVVAVEHIAYES